jgi:hypothetical protein
MTDIPDTIEVVARAIADKKGRADGDDATRFSLGH